MVYNIKTVQFTATHNNGEISVEEKTYRLLHIDSGPYMGSYGFLNIADIDHVHGYIVMRHAGTRQLYRHGIDNIDLAHEAYVDLGLIAYSKLHAQNGPNDNWEHLKNQGEVLHVPCIEEKHLPQRGVQETPRKLVSFQLHKEEVVMSISDMPTPPSKNY